MLYVNCGVLLTAHCKFIIRREIIIHNTSNFFMNRKHVDCRKQVEESIIGGSARIANCLITNFIYIYGTFKDLCVYRRKKKLEKLIERCRRGNHIVKFIIIFIQPLRNPSRNYSVHRVNHVIRPPFQ
jgi:phospholipid N-methyltransferase